MHRTTLTVAGLLGLAMLAPVAIVGSPAAAAVETCRGEPATIVGTDPNLTGTEGPDVIVTGPATTVSALGGDDVICVTTIGPTTVDAGRGDDVVVVGHLANHAELAGGAGRDVVAVDFTPDAAASIDMAAGRIREVGQYIDKTIGLSSFEAADVATTWPGGSGEPGPSSVSYRGTDGDDEVTFHFDTFASAPQVTVETYGGDDEIRFTDTLPHSDDARPRIDAGSGKDRLVFASPNGALDLDLVRGALRSNRVYGENGEYSEVVLTTVTGVEGALLMAPEVTLAGNRNDNELSGNGCYVKVRGGAGHDRLATVSGDQVWDRFDYGCTPTSTLAGGPGRDLLTGSAGKDKLRGNGGDDRLQGRRGEDVLLGGRGRDFADGGTGRDHCKAERSRHCER